MTDAAPISRPPAATGALAVTWSAGYRLRLPDGPPPSGGHPVLFGLHGFGDDAGLLDDRLAGLDGAPYARLFADGPFPVESKDAAGRARIGRSWYQYDGDQPRFMAALAFAEGYLRDVLATAAAAAPIDPTRVVLLGYSQGGYLAGVAAFRDRARYRGLVGIACRVKTEALAAELRDAQGYPALLLHGERDAHTPLERQREASDVLRAHGVAVDLRVHDGGHGVRRDAAPAIDAFARRVLGFPPPEERP